MKTVSESIYSDGNVVVAMALVQHIEKRQKPVYKSEHGFSKPTGESEPNGIMVITKFTNYNTELDDWDNPIYIGEDKARAFISAWTTYRAEVENNIKHPHE